MTWPWRIACAALLACCVISAVPAQTFPINRVDLIRYAGASGDFNPIHWNPRVATSVGLDDVIAHGMFTMATAVRVVTDWLGDPGAGEHDCRRRSEFAQLPSS